MLEGRLQENEYDNKNACEFLSLLGSSSETENRNVDFQPATSKDWKREVKKSKTTSAPSVFSRRTCVVHKCVLESARMTFMLVTFCNILFRESHCPKR